MRGLPRVALLLAVGAAATGCGSGGGTSSGAGGASPKQQLVDYLAALNRGDGRTACGLLTPQARADVPHISENIHAQDCEGAVRELSRISERIRFPRIAVHLSGNRAVATITAAQPPYRSQVPLARQDGGWRITYPPALVERYKTPPGIPNELKGRKKGR